MVKLHAPHVPATAQPHEGDTVAMGRVHVRLNLEHEARQLGLLGLHFTRGSTTRPRPGGFLDESLQQFFHAEIADGTTKEHGSELRRQILGRIERGRGTTDQFHFFAELGCFVAEERISLRRVQTFNDEVGTRTPFLRRFVGINAVFQQVVDALQPPAHANRPSDRRATQAQHLFHFIQQLDGGAALTVEFVDECHDGCIAQATHVHQLHGALFHALGTVDDHERAVHGRQRTVGVFTEIFVARRIQQIDDSVLVGKLHHRRGDGDTALLLQRHPVGGGMPCGFAPFHRASHLDSASEQQQLFGEGGLAGVRVRDDSEGAAGKTHGKKSGKQRTAMRPPRPRGWQARE